MARDIRVNIVGHDKLSRAVDDAHRKLGGFKGKVGGLLAGLGIGTAIVAGLKGAVNAARESNAVTKETETRIREMGNAANISAQQVGDLAEAISNKTGIDDEAVQSGANMLLTFGNIRNEAGKGRDVFNQATAAAVDMAAKFGGDASRQAITLGKALDNPSKGLSALTRIGVTFSEKEKQRIKTMQESGDMAGAQGLILQAVNRQVAGAAEANTTAQDKLNVKLGNIQERIGNFLVPILDRLATFVGKNTGLVITIVGALLALAGVVKVVTLAQTALNLAMSLNPIGIVIIAIAALVAGLVIAHQKSETFRNIVNGAFRTVLAAGKALWSGLQAAFRAIVSFVGSAASRVASLARSGFLGPIPLIISRWGSIVSFFRGLPGRIMGFLASLPGRMLGMGRSLVSNFVAGIRAMAGAVVSAISDIIPGPIKRFLHLSSPADEGPMSEDGGPERWGEKVSRLFITGMKRGASDTKRTLGGLPPGFPGFGGGGLVPAAAGAGGGGANVTINANTNASAADIGRELAWVLRTSGR